MNILSVAYSGAAGVMGMGLGVVAGLGVNAAGIITGNFFTNMFGYVEELGYPKDAGTALGLIMSGSIAPCLVTGNSPFSWAVRAVVILPSLIGAVVLAEERVQGGKVPYNENKADRGGRSFTAFALALTSAAVAAYVINPAIAVPVGCVVGVGSVELSRLLDCVQTACTRRGAKK